jgi:hypothetical protein
LDETPTVAPPADLERRAVWLAVAAGLVLVVHNPYTVFLGRNHVDRQLWFYIVSTALLGASALFAGLVALPELIGHPARIATRWNPVRLFGWAFALFVLGVVITAVAAVVGAGEALGTNLNG